jgi:cobalamin biosynthesis protein CbiG
MHRRLGPSRSALSHAGDIDAGGPTLTIGVGFRQGVTVDQIEAAVRAALAPNMLADAACVATLERKAAAPALVAFCERHALPLRAYSTQEVQACFAREPSLRGSALAYEHTGVQGVAEPCALLAAQGGKLVRTKRVLDGVTVAIGALAPQPGETDSET